MKRILILCAATIVVVFFCAACGKENKEPASDKHNPLYQSSYKGIYNVYGEREYNGFVYEWHYTYFLHLNFMSDTTVRFYGESWLTDNSYLKDGPREAGEWDDTMTYSFASKEGLIYGKEECIWDGDQTLIRYGENDSLQIETKQIGFVSMAKTI